MTLVTLMWDKMRNMDGREDEEEGWVRVVVVRDYL